MTEYNDVAQTNQNIDALFEADSSTVEGQAAELAEWIAIEDDDVAKLGAEVIRRKADLDNAKEKLAEILMQAGLQSIKLQSGLSLSVQINRKFFKAQGVSDEQLFAFLKANQLDGIIKPYVHFQTLQATLKDFEQQGNTLPEIINVSIEKTVRLNGKNKFLANLKG